MKVVPLVAFAAVLTLAGCSHPQPVYYPPPPPAASAIFQHGFHDGFEAARGDVASGRPPAFDHHPRFRNPPVPPPAWDEYRHAFRDGYERFLHRGPPPPPPGAY
jgi:predicted small lipoprotein YifL